jgi:hypothetical protein
MAIINDATGQKYIINPTTHQAQLVGQNQTVTPSGGSGLTNSQPLSLTPDWHLAVIWFLGAVALIALAKPAPQVATLIVVILIVLVLLGNWSTYASFLGFQ